MFFGKEIRYLIDLEKTKDTHFEIKPLQKSKSQRVHVSMSSSPTSPKTLGELWFNQRPLNDENEDNYNDHSSPSDEEEQNDIDSQTVTSHHFDPLRGLSINGGSLLLNQSPLNQQIPQPSLDIPTMVSKIKSGKYDTDTITITDTVTSRSELTMLSNALCENKTITTLRVTHCKLWSTDARILTYFLVRNRTLRTLDLSHNIITASGARAIAENLVGNTALRHLFLSANSIGNEGAKAFWHLLKGSDIKTMLGSKNGSKNIKMNQAQQAQQNKRNGPPECQLRTIGLDDNAIDDDRLLESITTLSRQKLPGSIHNKMKVIMDEKDQVQDEVKKLKEMISNQHKTLNKYRSKVSNSVMTEVEGGSKSKSRRRKGKKKKK